MLTKEKFHSSLTGRKITDKEHEHAFNVWNKSSLKTRKDYHNLNLKCDVLLLTDVFEKPRNNYGIIIMLNKLWTMAKSLFECSRFKLQCNAYNDKN